MVNARYRKGSGEWRRVGVVGSQGMDLCRCGVEGEKAKKKVSRLFRNVLSVSSLEMSSFCHDPRRTDVGRTLCSLLLCFVCCDVLRSEAVAAVGVGMWVTRRVIQARLVRSGKTLRRFPELSTACHFHTVLSLEFTARPSAAPVHHDLAPASTRRPPASVVEGAPWMVRRRFPLSVRPGLLHRRCFLMFPRCRPC